MPYHFDLVQQQKSSMKYFPSKSKLNNLSGNNFLFALIWRKEIWGFDHLVLFLLNFTKIKSVKCQAELLCTYSIPKLFFFEMITDLRKNLTLLKISRNANILRNGFIFMIICIFFIMNCFITFDEGRRQSHLCSLHNQA